MSAVLRCRQGRTLEGVRDSSIVRVCCRGYTVMAPLESVHVSECVHVMCVHV